MRLLLLFTAFALAGSSSAPGAAPPSVWSDLPADLPQDAAIRWGVLPNGVRYAVASNRSPKDHASLRLLVRVGSLWERDNERGMAHFVEHMAFRGTRAYPQGQLLRHLQRMGMALGPDTAAFTGYDFTVYQLELPDTQPATLRLGFDVLRQFASAITFDPKLIVLERTVINSELKLRDTPQSQVADFNLQYLFPGSRVVARKPIGLPEQFFRFTRDDLTGFYDAWYRPERMAVTAVGDLPPAQAIAEVTSAFADLRPRGPARPAPPQLYPVTASAHDVAVLHQPGWSGATVFLEHPVRYPAPALTHAERVREMLWALDYTILTRRLQRVARRPDPPFHLPSAGNGLPTSGWLMANANVSTRLPGLEAGLPALEQEHRRALVFGFSAEEVTRAQSELHRELLQAVASWPTRSSPARADAIQQHLLSGAALIEPAVFRTDMEAALEGVTPADCRAAFRALWTTSAPHVLVVVPPLAPVGRYSVANLLNLSRTTPVSLPKELAAAKLAYDRFGTPGKLARDDYRATSDVHLARFGNGVRLNFKHTDFDAHNVDFCVRVGEGWAANPGRPALRWIAGNGVTRGGLGRHSAQELADLLAGHDVSVDFVVRGDANIFYGRCSPEELPLALRVVGGYLTDAGFRPDEFEEVKSGIDAFLGDLDRSAETPIDLVGLAQIAGSDSRFQLPTGAQLHAATAKELAGWLGPQLRNGGVETTIVGDISWEAAEAAAEGTLGTINPRPAPPSLPCGAPAKFNQTPHRWRYPTADTVEDDGIGVFWVAPDVSTTREERRCHALSAVLNEMIFSRVREELGATYSPSASFVRYDSPPACAYFEVKMSVAPRHVNDVMAIISLQAERMAKRNLDADTFERALRPLIRSLVDERRTNTYWLYTVLDSAQSKPRALEDAEERIADYNSITPADVRKEASRYLRESNRFVFLTVPSPKRR